MFERFTERARQVVVLAQDEARALRHDYLGTEHLLLGLLRLEEGLAARALKSLDVTLEEVRAQVRRVVGQGDEPLSGGQIPFTPRAKKVLELSLREARSLGHNYIGTEHILLGLVRENEGVAARILLDLDADAEKVRNEVIRMLSGPAGAPDEPSRGDLISRIRAQKERAIEVGQFERAAQLRDEEERLLAEEVTSRARRRPRRYGYGAALPTMESAPLVSGWLLFGVSLGIGVLIGWSIWGL